MPYSYAQFACNGVVTDFAIPFPYITRSHVRVFTGYSLSLKTGTELVSGAGFTWLSDTTIRVSPALASGVTLTIVRSTPSNIRLVDWNNGSPPTPNELDLSDLQAFYISQEAIDNADLALSSATAALSIANSDGLNLLQYIPTTEHAAIRAKTSTYDCSSALQAALTVAGRIYIPPGKYRFTQTVIVNAAAGAIDRPVLLGAGGNNSTTIIEFIPSVAGSPLFSHFHSATYEGIYFVGPGATTGTGEEAFDFGNVGTQRHTMFRECMFRYWNKAALYFSGQWSFTIDNCRFIDCGNVGSPTPLTGGIVFDQTVVTNWSTSGMILSNTYFSGCSYGYYAESAWNLTLINPIFEFCAYPHWRNAGGSPHLIINPWYESNTNDPVNDGPVFMFGGRGVGWSGNNVTTSAESGSFHFAGGGIQVYKDTTPRANIKGNGYISFADGYGIDFSSVAGGGASGSIFNDYETGTWSPVVSDGTTNATATITTATYTKIGSMVRIRAAILNVNTTGLVAGNQLRISGLPYITGATANTWQHVPVTVADVSSTEGTIVGQIRNSSTQLLLNNQATTGLTSALVSQATSGLADFWLDFSYIA